MEHKALTDFLDQYEIDDAEAYLIARVKAVNRNKYPGKAYNKKIWINNLANYYKQKGIAAGKIGVYISEKTNVNYAFINRWLASEYKQKLDRLESYKEDIINDYNTIKNLTIVSKKYNTSVTNLGIFLKDQGIDVMRNPRHQFKLKKIKPTSKLSFLGEGGYYKLFAAYCDYLYTEPLTMNCTLIEEKQTLSQYTYGQAIMQLMLGEKIVQEKTEYIVINKIILCHRIGKNAQKTQALKHVIPDIKKYLNIEVVDLSGELLVSAF